MNYNVIINPEYSSNDNINNYNRKISNLLSDSLNSMNISNIVVNKNNENEKIDYINNYKNSNSIIITNGLGSTGIEIIYGLNRNDNFVSRLANNLEENNFNVSKYYQRRSSSNTNKDYDNVISNFPNNESIIIRYGNLSDSYVNNRIDDLTNVVSNTIKSYLGLSNDTYIVKKGDNIYSIARKYNTTVDNIKKLNNLTSNYLNIGQKLVVKSIPSTIKVPMEEGNYYTVVKGDTLYSIARKYNLSVDDLKKLNNLTNNVLNVGQRLKVESVDSNTYKVKSGDTLYSIARRYNISVDELVKLNNLTNDKLSIGQVLKIPSNNIFEYTVIKGDNLYSIANKYGVSVKDIMNINNLNSTNLSINQKLIIPRS